MKFGADAEIKNEKNIRHKHKTCEIKKLIIGWQIGFCIKYKPQK